MKFLLLYFFSLRVSSYLSITVTKLAFSNFSVFYFGIIWFLFYRMFQILKRFQANSWLSSLQLFLPFYLRCWRSDVIAAALVALPNHARGCAEEISDSRGRLVSLNFKLRRKSFILYFFVSLNFYANSGVVVGAKSVTYFYEPLKVGLSMFRSKLLS